MHDTTVEHQGRSPHRIQAELEEAIRPCVGPPASFRLGRQPKDLLNAAPQSRLVRMELGLLEVGLQGMGPEQLWPLPSRQSSIEGEAGA